MRIRVGKNVFLKARLAKKSILLGFDYMDMDEYWIFNIHLIIVHIQVYSGIMM